MKRLAALLWYSIVLICLLLGPTAMSQGPTATSQTPVTAPETAAGQDPARGQAPGGTQGRGANLGGVNRLPPS